MNRSSPLRVLAVNGGSSSLKFALYALEGDVEHRLLEGRCEGIGLSPGRFFVRDATGKALIESPASCRGHAEAAGRMLDWLSRDPRNGPLDGAGHRMVHGGMRYVAPERITPAMEAELSRLSRLDPEHLTQELSIIHTVRDAYPSLHQVACFDTAFHRQMPAVAQMHPLPRSLYDEGVVRFGFHGLSYEYLLQELARLAGPAEAGKRILIAHLGSGASLAAIRNGVSVDTTMGFMPSGGLMMGTRCGDLGPGVVLHLLLEKGLSPAAVNELVNFRSGLLGVSDISADMNALLRVEATAPAAREAVDLFCYTAKKHLGALAAVLGGLDTLVFSGGIGENAPAIRHRICDGLEFLGLRLDPERNARSAAIISAAGSPAVVRVIRSNEELMIARATAQVLRT